MSYLETYFSRINHMGETTAERIKNGGIRSFYKWMAESPHTVRQLSVERGLYFDAIILTSKDKEYQKIMFLNVANNIPLAVGDIMNWQLDDGSIEKWLLFSEEKKVNPTYRTFWMVRCNYFIKWIDADGHLQSSWSYVVSSLDSKIKGNYRTWNNLITPQPNKYAEILMPRRVVDRATNFIIEEESWQVIEYDHTSVPGTIYLSLTENKINFIYDDTQNEIADLDKRAKYELVLPPTTQIFNIGEAIQPIYTIMKNGVPTAMEVELVSKDKQIAKIQNGILTAVGEGEVDIQVVLKNCTDIEPQELLIHIEVGAAETEFSCYIEGKDKIRLGKKEIYTLCSTSGVISEEVEFSIDNVEYATFERKINNNTCEIKANNKNKLKSFVLYARIGNNTYEKTIQVVPLW